MYFAGVLTFFVALTLYITSRRRSAPPRVGTLRGLSYVLLGISLLLGAEQNTDWVSWLVRVFGAFVLAQGSLCLLSASKARSQNDEPLSQGPGSD